jgi:hypothetical protein
MVLPELASVVLLEPVSGVLLELAFGAQPLLLRTKKSLIKYWKLHKNHHGHLLFINKVKKPDSYI